MHMSRRAAATTLVGGFTALSTLLAAPLQAAKAKGKKHCLTALYPWQPDARFDFDYYHAGHAGMMRKFFGDSVGAMQVRHGLRKSDGSPPAFIATVTVEIRSLEEFDAATKAHIQELFADLPNFTNVTPVGQIEEIVE